MAELGDKTFLILFIFTIAWSNPGWATGGEVPV